MYIGLKTKFKRHMQENFTTVRGCFGLDTARVKAPGELKKERKKENEDDEGRFSPFPGSSL